MADIRINALATTATTPASDDYLALDGTAQGTRKILATNIANNVTDVILGASGPSVKSSLSARAPRQGLVFDGSACATVSNVPAFGAADFTFSGVINSKTIPALTIITEADANGFGLRFESNGLLIAYQRGGLDKVTATTAVTAGKSVAFSYVRSSGVGTFYINGIAAGTDNDGTNYSAGNYVLAPSGNLIGTLSVLIYNRALSASEVVALFEAGVPSGADYGLIGQPASNTSIITGDSSTFTGGVGNWTGFNGGSISAVGGKGVITMASYHQGAANNTNQMVAGRRYRLTVTVSALAGGSYVLLTDYNSVEYASLTAGVNVVEFISSSNTGIAFKQGNSGTTSASVDDISLLPLGLLLAPDAAQAGGGLVWYDTSGNAANISWTSGVSWNVPSSQKTASGWTYGGNLTVSSSSAYLKLASTGSSNTWDLFSDSNGSFYLSQSGVVNALRVFPTTGNFSIGAGSTDLGQKLQVSGTAYVSGDATFAGQLNILSANSYLKSDASNLVYETYAGKGHQFKTGGTTALTLDSSQNATFAGNVAIQNGNALRLNNPANNAYASLRLDASNIVLANYDWSFADTIIANKATTAFRIPTAETPASASATGTIGTITWDTSYIYVCTATNTWKRVAIATW